MELDQVEVALEVRGLEELDQVVLEVQGLVDLDLAEPVLVAQVLEVQVLEVQVLVAQVLEVQVLVDLAEAELVGGPGRGPVEMKLQGQAEMKIFLDQAELTCWRARR